MSEQRRTATGARIVIKVDPELQDLIPGFLENRRNDLKAIRTALDQGDFDTIRYLGHGMKGMGGGYGFEQITHIGGSLERAAIGKQSQIIERDAEQLSSYLDRIEVVFEEPE
ncbi:MAG: hypothetical protein QOD06_193 [Candidatus Binatota bacterium]|jgi:HPt (histidine-containing phosphotransfer) domain-containing protein|nr:hypothetical protein [Candidatus Binatota bacterium]